MSIQDIKRKQSIINFNPTHLVMLLIVAIFTGAAIYHIIQQPYPNNWDDAWYTIHTHRWLSLIHDLGFIKGLYRGYLNLLPGEFPPMVIFTSLFGAMVVETITVMRLVQLGWLIITMLAVYGIGSKLADDRWVGILSVFLVASSGLVFYWGKTIMGEPSLFAFISLSFLLIIQWGAKITPLRGLILGFVLGLGTLTKQQYLIIIFPPMAIWFLWVLKEYKFEKASRSRILKAIALLVFATMITSIAWYGLHFKESIAYITATRSNAHNLLSISILKYVSLYINNLNEQIGWPSLLLLLLGIIYGGYQIFSKKWAELWNNWNILSKILLLSSMIILFLSILGSKNINTRFIATAFIPGGILAALAVGNLWSKGPLLLRTILIVFLFFQALYFLNQNFYTRLPKLLKFLPQSSFMRPIDIEPLPEAIELLKENLPMKPETMLWVGGGNSHFNHPLVKALIELDGQPIQTRSIFSFQTDNLSNTLEPIKSGEYILLYENLGERPDIFTYYEYDAPLRQFDQFISNWIRSHSDSYEKLFHLESDGANNQISLYRYNPPGANQ